MLSAVALAQNLFTKWRLPNLPILQQTYDCSNFSGVHTNDYYLFIACDLKEIKLKKLNIFWNLAECYKIFTAVIYKCS